MVDVKVMISSCKKVAKLRIKLAKVRFKESFCSVSCELNQSIFKSTPSKLFAHDILSYVCFASFLF